MRAAYVLYQILGWLVLPFAAPVVLARALHDARYRVGWRERFGSWGAVPRNGIWIHGASVGEMRAATPLIRRLREAGETVLLTTTSPAGRDAARDLAGADGAARLLPLDLAWLVRRVLRAARPRVLVVVETEIWPSLFRETSRRGVPIHLVNGRISDRALPRYRRVRRWIAPLLRCCASIQAQSARDADRFRELGAPPKQLRVGGNMKFDLAAPDPGDPAATALRRARADGWRVLVGGSTHPGEEEALLEATEWLEGAGYRVGLVVAPRHLERCDEVRGLLAAAGRTPANWSTLGEPPEESILNAFREHRPLLVDRYGVLGSLYGGGECAFVGGTLSPVGGHNLLEPLNWGVPVLFGPHTENTPEIRDEVLERQLGRKVEDAVGLARAVAEYWRDEELTDRVRSAAGELFAANRGAAAAAIAAVRTGAGGHGRAGSWDSTSG